MSPVFRRLFQPCQIHRCLHHHRAGRAQLRLGSKGGTEDFTDFTRDFTRASYIWVNYNISLTWIKAIWGWFPLLTMIPVRSQWGRYNLPRYMGNSSHLPSFFKYLLFKINEISAILMFNMKFPINDVIIWKDFLFNISGDILSCLLVKLWGKSPVRMGKPTNQMGHVQ